MKAMKKGTLKSGRSGKKVTSRKQAIAIGLSEARKSGAKVPKEIVEVLIADSTIAYSLLLDPDVDPAPEVEPELLPDSTMNPKLTCPNLNYRTLRRRRRWLFRAASRVAGFRSRLDPLAA